MSFLGEAQCSERRNTSVPIVLPTENRPTNYPACSLGGGVALIFFSLFSPGHISLSNYVDIIRGICGGGGVGGWVGSRVGP